MAWIIGLADDKEIEAILKAGYSLRTHEEMLGIKYFALPEEDSKGIAVFVDCDVQDLLDIKGT